MKNVYVVQRVDLVISVCNNLSRTIEFINESSHCRSWKNELPSYSTIKRDLDKLGKFSQRVGTFSSVSEHYQIVKIPLLKSEREKKVVKKSKLKKK